MTIWHGDADIARLDTARPSSTSGVATGVRRVRAAPGGTC